MAEVDKKRRATLPTVFISYSHKDEEWKDRLHPHLGILRRVGHIDLWDDRRIGSGAEWYDEIKGAMEKAAVAVCLISADYLDSDFINKEEIPYLLERYEKEGMVLIPVLLRPCPWKVFSWLRAIQMIPRDGKCVCRDFRGNEDEPFAQVAERINEIVTAPDYAPPAPPPPAWEPPENVNIARMPETGAKLFGRRDELALLDDVWDSDTTHILSFVAWGGVGKSTLVNKWLAQMAEDNYRGARRVYAWSFYSQGTGERVTSADLFIATALAWFGDPDPTQGSPWDKGQRLAELVRQEKTLLVLDGMEPLQSYLDYERGKVTDPALATLLAELARENPGLCLITTREPVADLARCPDTTLEKNLEQISDGAGRALLRVGGVQGTDAEMEQATRDFGNHALALNLLAAYLHALPGHPIAAAAGIPDLPDVSADEGKHPRRVMAAFAARFGAGPEVELLRVLGLFDRPADAGEIAALREPPPIPDLTEHIQALSEGDWLRLLERLRKTGLIAPESTHRPGALDAHPLVREHFGAQLQRDYPAAWREGNARLYEHLKAAAKERPDTLEEMLPLYAAVAHGCRAGRHQEALDEVYWQRIRRGNEAFSVHKLGAIGADLATLSGFFGPPWRKPADGLTEEAEAAFLGWAGFLLRALGRLAEAAQPMQTGLEARIAQEDWENAAKDASNLSELHLTVGDVAQAVDTAHQSVELADRSGDAFMRMYTRTTLADALHQAGRLEEAAARFREAEAMQQERQPGFPLLYSVQGYRYCDLLLDQGQAAEVRRRATQSIKIAQRNNWLLDIALGHLSLGRAHLMLARQTSEVSQDFGSLEAAAHLNRAVDGLRQAGTQHHIPLGLLARATLFRAQGEYNRAQRDLDEALAIATRGGMRLFEADCHLEYARLYLTIEQQGVDLRGLERTVGSHDLGGLASEHLAKARDMIAEMGYHRRDGEVAALEETLGEG
jgi:tetratricopeptide (TPR) repeat protein